MQAPCPSLHLRGSATLRQRSRQQAHQALQHSRITSIQPLLQEGGSQGGAGSGQRGSGAHR